MCVLYKIEYIIHGYSIIILTHFFEPCCVAADELYIVRFINSRGEGGILQQKHAAHQIQRLCVFVHLHYLWIY